MSNAGRVILGVIIGAHGVRGAVRLKSFTSAPEAVASYGAVELGGSGRQAVIRQLRPSGRDFVAVLDGVSDRSAAEALKGCLLHVARDRLPPPADDEVYVGDVIGLKVYRRDGCLLGEVAAVTDFGAGDLLEIRSASRRSSIMIPFVAAMVPEVDVAKGRIVVDPPEGLIEAQEQPRASGRPCSPFIPKCSRGRSATRLPARRSSAACGRSTSQTSGRRRRTGTGRSTTARRGADPAW